MLLLTYEGMKRDLEGVVRRVADFIGIALDDELLELTLHQASLAFMTEHKDKYDDLMLRERSERVAGLPPGSDSAKVREGAVGSRKRELPPAIQAELDEAWAEEIEPRLGFASYDDLPRRDGRRLADSGAGLGPALQLLGLGLDEAAAGAGEHPSEELHGPAGGIDGERHARAAARPRLDGVRGDHVRARAVGLPRERGPRLEVGHVPVARAEARLGDASDAADRERPGIQELDGVPPSGSIRASAQRPTSLPRRERARRRSQCVVRRAFPGTSSRTPSVRPRRASHAHPIG